MSRDDIILGGINFGPTPIPPTRREIIGHVRTPRQFATIRCAVARCEMNKVGRCTKPNLIALDADGKCVHATRSQEKSDD